MTNNTQTCKWCGGQIFENEGCGSSYGLVHVECAHEIRMEALAEARFYEEDYEEGEMPYEGSDVDFPYDYEG